MPTAVEHCYRPRGTQKALFTDKRPMVLVAGPAGTGKSRACLEKLHLICMMVPNVRAAIVRRTFTSLRTSALLTYKQHVALEYIDNGVHIYGGTIPQQIQYANGSTIDVIGMDKSTRIMSTEYDIIYVQEATELELEQVDALSSRLRGTALSYRQLLMDCNPADDNHFLLQLVAEGKLEMLESLHEENPRYFDYDPDTQSYTLTAEGEAYLARLDNLSGFWLQRLRWGKWVGAHGVIYDNFQKQHHIVDNFDIPASWSRFWTIDFGYVHPFVCQMWAEDGDGRLYLYKELYLTHSLVEDIAPILLRNMDKKPDKIICDHDAEDRATLRKHLGMATTPAKKDVSPGIQATHARFKVQKDSKARLYIFRNTLMHDPDPHLKNAKAPTCTAQEIGGYVWKPGGKEEPLKERDDGCDAMRYMVADRDLVGEYRVRWL